MNSRPEFVIEKLRRERGLSAFDCRRFYEHFNFDRSPIDPFQMMLLLKDIRKALR